MFIETYRCTPLLNKPYSANVGCYEGDKLIYAGKVRNGFVPRLGRDVWQKLKRFEIASCPVRQSTREKRTQFSLIREEMKNCIWLKPQLVAQIEFTEWTPDAHLWHSKFIGLRDDKEQRMLCAKRIGAGERPKRIQRRRISEYFGSVSNCRGLQVKAAAIKDQDPNHSNVHEF